MAAGTFGNPQIAEEEVDILIIGGGMACCGAAYEMMRWAKAATEDLRHGARTVHRGLADELDLRSMPFSAEISRAMQASSLKASSARTQVEARTKLLITISDGKPDDYHDGYRGQYGIDDTRQALDRGQAPGRALILHYHRSVAKEYLSHMCGAAHYVIVDDVKTLPTKVADVYRRLTT